ncbi:hypothetical protein GQR58_015605 [Nymphon striatum]|nr:hypothetical protein GQR58_015605 [Nymphon striatum]
MQDLFQNYNNNFDPLIFVSCRFMDRVNSTETFVGVSIVLQILTGIGFTFYKGSIYNTFIERFPNIISTLMGYTAASYGVGISIGPFIGGVLYDFGGFGLPLFVTSGVIGSLFIAMLILFPKIDFPYHKKSEAEQFKQSKDDRSLFSIFLVKSIYPPFLCLIAYQMSISFMDLALANHVMKTVSSLS